MNARKPRIEDVVSSLTARLAAAHEIRAHAARLLEMADAQQDAARAEARHALGDHGERLYHVVLGAYDHDSEDGSRIAEVPGLADSLTPPWSSDRESRPAEPLPAASSQEPLAIIVPQETRPPRQATAVAAAVQPPVAAEARPRSLPVAPSGEVTMYGMVIARTNVAAGEKIVRQARDFVATGDASHFETHGAKWVGVHQWRRDLFRAAFAEEARNAGLPLTEASGEDADRDERSLEQVASDPPPVHMEPEPIPGFDGPDAGMDERDMPYDEESSHEDVVFGADEEPSPLPVLPAAASIPLHQPLPAFLAELDDDSESETGWPPPRDGPAMPHALAPPGAKIAPGLSRLR